MPDYRVNLEIYNGPIDLLLYLIRRDEVDIYDIPIARITAQYVQYIEVLQQLDPNLADAHLNLGRIYTFLGANARARASFEAFLAKATPKEYGRIIPMVKAELARMP